MVWAKLTLAAYCAGVLNNSNAPGPGRTCGKLSDVAQRPGSREFHVSRYRSSACNPRWARRSDASLPSGVCPPRAATLDKAMRLVRTAQIVSARLMDWPHYDSRRLGRASAFHRKPDLLLK